MHVQSGIPRQKSSMLEYAGYPTEQVELYTIGPLPFAILCYSFGLSSLADSL